MSEKPLPEGYKTLEDESIIKLLCEDALFIESIEAEYGKLRCVYPDWRQDALVYDFVRSEPLCSNLTEIIRVLKDIEYLKSYQH